MIEWDENKSIITVIWRQHSCCMFTVMEWVHEVNEWNEVNWATASARRQWMSEFLNFNWICEIKMKEWSEWEEKNENKRILLNFSSCWRRIINNKWHESASSNYSIQNKDIYFRIDNCRACWDIITVKTKVKNKI